MQQAYYQANVFFNIVNLWTMHNSFIRNNNVHSNSQQTFSVTMKLILAKL